MGFRISEQKRLEWQKHFEAQKKSGLTKSKYCRLNNLSIDNFNYHLKRMSEQTPIPSDNASSPSSSDFISVIVEPSSNTPSPIELSFEHQGQSLILKVRWTTSELIEFLKSWRAS